MADIDDIARKFLQVYYQTFDLDRTKLAYLYRPGSTLTVDGDVATGTDQIIQKLMSLPFEKVQHTVATQDVQASDAGGILIVCTGTLIAGEQPQRFNYTEVFLLVQEGPDYFIQNDVVRFVGPNP